MKYGGKDCVYIVVSLFNGKEVLDESRKSSSGRLLPARALAGSFWGTTSVFLCKYWKEKTQHSRKRQHSREKDSFDLLLLNKFCMFFLFII
jgi:hypothetical protein